MKKTTITFDQAGGMKVDATGFVGKACAETTAKLLQGLGSETKAETKKPEYLHHTTSGSSLTSRL